MVFLFWNAIQNISIYPNMCTVVSYQLQATACTKHAQIHEVHSLTCKARHTDTSISMNKVYTCGIVQAGWRYTLIYVDFTVVPCKDMAFKQVSDHKSHTASLICKRLWVMLSFPLSLSLMNICCSWFIASSCRKCDDWWHLESLGCSILRQLSQKLTQPDISHGINTFLPLCWQN